jgi:hypothetical protein
MCAVRCQWDQVINGATHSVDGDTGNVLDLLAAQMADATVTQPQGLPRDSLIASANLGLTSSVVSASSSGVGGQPTRSAERAYEALLKWAGWAITAVFAEH